jgi:negative regulator of sigma E activity
MVTPAESLGMVVVESGEGIWLFHPRKQSWRQMSWRAPESRPQLLLRNYDVHLQGREKVAGRRVFVLRLTARHPGNPSKRVWLDSETKLALRQELYDPAGRRLSTSEFREISFAPSLPANLFTVPVEARVERRREGAPLPPWAAAGKANPSQTCEQPRYVPAGYELAHRICMKRPDREFAHLRYTDGLNTISLFIERSAAQKQGRGLRDGHWSGAGTRAGYPPSGATRVARGGGGGKDGRAERGGSPQRGEHGQRFTLRRGDTRYTLVGNINLSELRRMAESIPTRGDWSGNSQVETAGGSPHWKR